MKASSSARRRRLAITLGTVFVLAIVMGAGPGIYLVNPDRNDLQATFTVLGVPVIYAWVVFWFLVQAGVVLVAYCRLWDGAPADDSPRTEETAGRAQAGQAPPDENSL